MFSIIAAQSDDGTMVFRAHATQGRSEYFEFAPGKRPWPRRSRDFKNLQKSFGRVMEPAVFLRY
jgi:hypothetical protein